ncbi:MAG: hypothetical protein ACYDCC_08545 [Actinomycetota bacterium]
MAPKENWKQEPDDHDYPAAESYLSLIFPEPSVRTIVSDLKEAPIALYKAKDLLRASALPSLTKDNEHVAKDLAKVKGGKKLSPVLLVRGNAHNGVPLIIADGYHRICASYLLKEDASIPCKIVELR